MKNLVQRAGRLVLALGVVGSVGLNGCKSTDTTTTVYGNWTTSSSFAGSARRGAVTFTLNNVAYVGTGIDASGTRLRDLWSFDPGTGSWNRMADLPTAAVARYSAVAFAANGKGYVGTGLDEGNRYLADFWEFTPPTTSAPGGSWRRVNDIPAGPNGAGRYGAVAATLNNMGYVGCGFDGANEKDFFAFTPPTTATGMGSWAALTAGFPGFKRVNGVAFVVGGNMYVATGTNNGQNQTDVYAFNGTAWTQKNSLINKTSDPAYDYSAVARTNAAAFTVNDKAYVATGTTSATCYQYNPSADTWTVMNPILNATARNNAVAFGIGNYGYVGLGSNGSSAFDDFYRIDPTLEQQ